MLPDESKPTPIERAQMCLNAPTGAWCSLTRYTQVWSSSKTVTQCTYRCVVLPDCWCVEDTPHLG